MDAIGKLPMTEEEKKIVAAANVVVDEKKKYDYCWDFCMRGVYARAEVKHPKQMFMDQYIVRKDDKDTKTRYISDIVNVNNGEGSAEQMLKQIRPGDIFVYEVPDRYQSKVVKMEDRSDPSNITYVNVPYSDEKHSVVVLEIRGSKLIVANQRSPKSKPRVRTINIKDPTQVKKFVGLWRTEENMKQLEAALAAAN